jgi:hypothetical protein
LSNQTAGVLGKALFIGAAIGVLGVTRRIDDPLVASGNVACAAILVIAIWRNTTVRLARSTGVPLSGTESSQPPNLR